MALKQRGLYFILAAVTVVLLSAFSTLNFTSISYASYPPGADGKCNDKQAPKEKDSKGEPACADDQKPPTAGAGQQDEQGGQSGNDEVTCAIEKIGWILCPVIETAGWASDKLFYFLANNLLEIEPELFNVTAGGSKAATVTNSDGSTTQTQTTKQNGTYQAWGLAKDLANVAFIAAFVVIVISQVTSYGISNYGIKRMLPRLIVAAIAVNVSYFICQGVVDLSNILGYNLHKALVDIAAQVGPSPFAGGAGSGGEFESSDGIMGKIAMLVLATAGIVWILMGPLAAMLLFVIITVVTITLILLMRKAFIVLLVVASPLAFVAYLLPNTEQYFQKWWGMFWKLLLVFPIVALLMGGGQLASAIILSAGATTATEVKSSCKSGSGTTSKSLNKGNECEGTVEVANGGKRVNVSWSLGLIATGVAVAPLLAVWSVLQGAISAAGAIGGKMAAAVNRVQERQKGSLADKTKKRREFLANEAKTRAMSGERGGKLLNIATFGSVRRSAKRDGKYKKAAERLNAAQEAYNEGARLGTPVTTNDVQKKMRLLQNAASQKVENENIAAIQYEHRDKDTGELGKELDAARARGDETTAKALVMALEKHGGAGADEIAKAITSAEAAGNKATVDMLRSVVRNNTDLKGKRADIASWATDNHGATAGSPGGRSLYYHATNQDTYNKLTDSQLASQTTSSFGQASATGALNEQVAMVDKDGNRVIKNRANRLAQGGDMSGSNQTTNAGHTN